MLRVTPMIGGISRPTMNRSGVDYVVLLSYGLWQRHYGGDNGILGKTILLDEEPYIVIGVLPRGFSLYGTLPDFEVWRPFQFHRTQLDREDHELVMLRDLKTACPSPRPTPKWLPFRSGSKETVPGFDQKNGIRVVGFTMSW